MLILAQFPKAEEDGVEQSMSRDAFVASEGSCREAEVSACKYLTPWERQERIEVREIQGHTPLTKTGVRYWA